MKDLKVWMRVGDQDDYHDFDSPEGAAYDLHDLLHSDEGQCRGHIVMRHESSMLYGVNIVGEGYEGQNAVSLYWGDDDAQFAAELSDLELDAFRNVLATT